MPKHVCKGCGAELQIEYPNRPGYTLNLEHTYCQSCYRLFHYGESNEHFHPEDLPKLSEDSIAVMVSSVMNLDMLFQYPVYRYEPNITYVYLINQIDLLPEHTNLDTLLANAINRAKKMHVPYKDIILMSAKNRYDIEQLKNYLLKFKKKYIYLIGVQNAGKTTIYKELVGNKEALAMNKAGLTQEAIFEKLNDYTTIFDMPGLYQGGYLHQFISYQQYKNLLPSKTINPKIYQLNNNQGIFLEGLVSIMTINPTSIVIYGSKQLEYHKTNRSRVIQLLKDKENHFKIYAEDYETRIFKIPEGKWQLTFADFAFIHVSGKTSLEITYPKMMHISLTEALFQ